MMTKDLPQTVQLKLNDFTEEQKRAFFSELERRKKSVGVGYLALLFLGWHYAYIRKWGLQLLCLITLWGFLLWWIVDWFRLPKLIKNYNKDVAIQIINEMR